MGSLMPIGSGPDAEIIAVLNKVFSGRNLDSLRAHEGLTGESIFDRHHKLHRIAFRIGAYPARDYSPDDAKRKWFYFLHRVLPPPTEKAIKRILKDALLPNSKIKAVQFFVEENSAASAPHLFPSNSEPLSGYLDPTGPNLSAWRHFFLPDLAYDFFFGFFFGKVRSLNDGHLIGCSTSFPLSFVS